MRSVSSLYLIQQFNVPAGTIHFPRIFPYSGHCVSSLIQLHLSVVRRFLPTRIITHTLRSSYLNVKTHTHVKFGAIIFTENKPIL